VCDPMHRGRALTSECYGAAMRANNRLMTKPRRPEVSFEHLTRLFAAGARGTVLRWSGRGKGYLDIFINSATGDNDGTYRLLFPIVVGSTVHSKQSFDSLSMVAEHVILRDYREPMWDVFLNPSDTSESVEFLARLRSRTSSYYEGWATELNRQLFEPELLEERLARRYGLFYQHASAPVKEMIMSLAPEYGLRMAALGGVERKISPETRLLLLDHNYILGELRRVEVLET
jgi:hypothetical protein